MLDELRRKWVDPLHDAAVARLGMGMLIGVTVALGIAAAVSVAVHAYLLGLVFFVLNRLAAVLTRFQTSVAGISIIDLLIYAALAFGFAIADPSRALAASFLMLGVVVLLSCAVLFGAIDAVTPRASVIIGITIFIAIAVSCIWPERFSLAAYLFGLLCFPLAGTFVASSVVRRS